MEEVFVFPIVIIFVYPSSSVIWLAVNVIRLVDIAHYAPPVDSLFM